MGTVIWFLKRFLIFILFTQQYVAADDNDDDTCECIAMMTNTDADARQDVQVTAKLSIKQEEGEEDGAELAVLEGLVNVTTEIPDDNTITIAIDVVLLSSDGKQTVWSASLNLCEFLQKPEEPLKSIGEMFGGKCPVPKDVYEVKKFILNLDFLSAYLTEDWVGKYVVYLVIKQGMDVLFQLELGAVVDVMKRKCDKCPKEERRKK